MLLSDLFLVEITLTLIMKYVWHGKKKKLGTGWQSKGPSKMWEDMMKLMLEQEKWECCCCCC